MVSSRRSKVAFAVQALTSDEYEPSDFSDSSALQALVTKYFADGSDDTDYDVSSNEEEAHMFY